MDNVKLIHGRTPFINMVLVVTQLIADVAIGVEGLAELLKRYDKSFFVKYACTWTFKATNLCDIQTISYEVDLFAVCTFSFLEDKFYPLGIIEVTFCSCIHFGWSSLETTL